MLCRALHSNHQLHRQRTRCKKKGRKTKVCILVVLHRRYWPGFSHYDIHSSKRQETALSKNCKSNICEGKKKGRNKHRASWHREVPITSTDGTSNTPGHRHHMDLIQWSITAFSIHPSFLTVGDDIRKLVSSAPSFAWTQRRVGYRLALRMNFMATTAFGINYLHCSQPSHSSVGSSKICSSVWAWQDIPDKCPSLVPLNWEGRVKERTHKVTYPSPMKQFGPCWVKTRNVFPVKVV